MIKSLKFIKIQGLMEARPPGIWPENLPKRLGFGQKICPGGWDLAVFENLPWGL